MANDQPTFIEITKDSYEGHFTLLSKMTINEKYSEEQLRAISGFSKYKVENIINFLRSCLNFIYKGQIHHIALSQLSKKKFAYILKEGTHTSDSDFFLPPELTQ
jgi:hypothetical protein